MAANDIQLLKGLDGGSISGGGKKFHSEISPLGMREQRTRTTKDVGLTVQALDREISSGSTSFLCRKHSKEIMTCLKLS